MQQLSSSNLPASGEVLSYRKNLSAGGEVAWQSGGESYNLSFVPTFKRSFIFIENPADKIAKSTFNLIKKHCWFVYKKITFFIAFKIFLFWT